MQELRDHVVAGDADAAAAATVEALDAGMDASTIMNDGLIPAMDVVGRQFSTGEIYVPEMLVSALAMKKCLEYLKPHLLADRDAYRGGVVIGSVKGDLHDIGKNIVAMMLEGAGFEVEDLGVDVAPATFVDAVRATQPRIVALSCLLTTTMPMMSQTIDALEDAGIRTDVCVLVGGAPVTDAYATKIGADGYAPNAAAGVQVAKSL